MKRLGIFLGLALVLGVVFFPFWSEPTQPTDRDLALAVEPPGSGSHPSSLTPLASEEAPATHEKAHVEPSDDEGIRPSPSPLLLDSSKPLPSPRMVAPLVTSELSWVQGQGNPLEDPQLNPDGLDLSDDDQEAFADLRGELAASVHVAFKQVERAALAIARRQIETGEYQVLAQGEEITLGQDVLGYVFQPLDDHWSAIVILRVSEPEIRQWLDALRSRQQQVLDQLHRFLKEHGR